MNSDCAIVEIELLEHPDAAEADLDVADGHIAALPIVRRRGSCAAPWPGPVLRRSALIP